MKVLQPAWDTVWAMHKIDNAAVGDRPRRG